MGWEIPSFAGYLPSRCSSMQPWLRLSRWPRVLDHPKVFEDLSRHAGAHFEASSPHVMSLMIILTSTWNWVYFYVFLIYICLIQSLILISLVILVRLALFTLFTSSKSHLFCQMLKHRFVFGRHNKCFQAFWKLVSVHSLLWPIWHMIILFDSVDPLYFGCFVPVVFGWIHSSSSLNIVLSPFLVRPCQNSRSPVDG